mmetsp:Transcript_85330/g.228180  ORF Transcript_85330/g.228180 Transcript_85330/m.228180 type:complete len:194 (-) Transcript_85330:426-1007(-)
MLAMWCVASVAAVTVHPGEDQELVLIDSHGEVEQWCGLKQCDIDRCGISCGQFEVTYCEDWEQIVERNIIKRAADVCCSNIPEPCLRRWARQGKRKYCSSDSQCLRPGCSQEHWYADLYRGTTAALNDVGCLCGSSQSKCQDGAADFKLKKVRKLGKVMQAHAALMERSEPWWKATEADHEHESWHDSSLAHK